jgi:CO/xanthine dehydrogenase Mo-binding subunit
LVGRRPTKKYILLLDRVLTTNNSIMPTINRRDFIQTTAGLSIGFTLFGCFPQQKEAAVETAAAPSTLPARDIPEGSQIDAWLQILEDGSVRVLTGKMELGQGLTVAMQQVAGEELNTPPEKIKIVLADTGLTQNEGYTAGSRSMERSAMQVRRAAAAAKALLISVAAEQWNLAAGQIEVKDGQVIRLDNNEKISFKDLLADRQLEGGIPDDVALKPKEQYEWVGEPIPHPDMEKIVRGEALYVQDMHFPGMVHARVVKPKVYGAQLSSRPQEVQQMPGVLQVIQNGSFLVVLAEEEFQAVQAMKALAEGSEWSVERALPKVDSWADYMEEAGGASGLNTRNATHAAVYSKPYTMHGSIGPSCAIALYEEGQLHIWSHTQGVYPLRSSVSDLTGLAEENIRVSGVRGSGCYGHNGADDVAADAALLAMAYPGKHIRLQWQRENEHQWEPYGSAMRMELAATLTSDGKISSWDYHLWSDGHSTRPRGDAGNLVSSRYLEQPFAFNPGARVGGGTRNSEPYYDIPGARVQDHYVKGPLRVSALRSLGAYANIFAIECFMEELAEKAEKDPLDFRIQHSTDERSIAVLQKLKELVQNETSGEGEGMGFGFSRYKNTASYCAVAAKVKVDLESKKVTPLKMWAVIDAGETINPDGIKNQTEGGLIQAASWTLMEEVLFEADQVNSKDWSGYPILRYDAIPETEVHIIDRPELPALGAGEAAQGPGGAAIANAVYAACGKRVRELPVEKHL